jgi:hypothetical protein
LRKGERRRTLTSLVSASGAADTTSKHQIDARTAWLLTHGELPPAAVSELWGAARDGGRPSWVDEVAATDILEVVEEGDAPGNETGKETGRVTTPPASQSPASPPLTFRRDGAPPPVVSPILALPRPAAPIEIAPEVPPPGIPAMGESLHSVDVSVDVPRRGGPAPWIIGVLALGVLATLGALVAARSLDRQGRYPRSSLTVVQSAPPPEGVTAARAEPSTGIPSVGVDSLPFVSATHGTLRFAPSAHDHRVYVDGVLVGGSNAPLRVRCGEHLVRVGSRGEERSVDVPCGGTVDVR